MNAHEFETILEKIHEHCCSKKGELKIMADVIVDVRITVAPAATPLSVDPSGVSGNATVGVGYTGKLVATGGTPPYKAVVTNGALPDGLSLDSDALTISGTPTTEGSFDAEIDVSDSAAVPASVRIKVGQ